SFLHRLNGMFAIALLDYRRQKLFLIRDRLGIKPIHFAIHGNLMLWASEVKAILATHLIPASPRWEAVYSAFRLEATPAPATCFESIETLPAGCYLEINATTGQRQTHQYWDIPF